MAKSAMAGDTQISARAYWTYLTVMVVVMVLVTNFLNVKKYSSNRYLKRQRIAAGMFLVGKGPYYRGETMLIGWPVRFLGIRYESTDTTLTSPMRLGIVKTSVVALLLNLVAVLAFIVGVGQTRGFFRRGAAVWRLLIILLCVASLISIAALSQHNYLGLIPVYPEDVAAPLP